MKKLDYTTKIRLRERHKEMMRKNFPPFEKLHKLPLAECPQEEGKPSLQNMTQKELDEITI